MTVRIQKRDATKIKTFTEVSSLCEILVLENDGEIRSRIYLTTPQGEMFFYLDEYILWEVLG